MKISDGVFYEVISMKHDYSLMTYSETVEGLCEEIDRSNKRCMEQGYKPTQYFITKTTVHNVYDDNGYFVFKNTSEEVVMKYPETLPEIA